MWNYQRVPFWPLSAAGSCTAQSYSPTCLHEEIGVLTQSACDAMSFRHSRCVWKWWIYPKFGDLNREKNMIISLELGIPVSPKDLDKPKYLPHPLWNFGGSIPQDPFGPLLTRWHRRWPEPDPAYSMRLQFTGEPEHVEHGMMGKRLQTHPPVLVAIENHHLHYIDQSTTGPYFVR